MDTFVGKKLCTGIEPPMTKKVKVSRKCMYRRLLQIKIRKRAMLLTRWAAIQKPVACNRHGSHTGIIIPIAACDIKFLYDTRPSYPAEAGGDRKEKQVFLQHYFSKCFCLPIFLIPDSPVLPDSG